MADDPRDESTASPASPPARQPYTAPQLIDYGSVAELTQGAAGTRTDGHPVKKFVQP